MHPGRNSWWSGASAFPVPKLPRIVTDFSPNSRGLADVTGVFNQLFRSQAIIDSQFCAMCSQRLQLDDPWTQSRKAPVDRDLARSSCGSSDSSTTLDEEEPNQRLKPVWQKYQHHLCTRGLCLDTIRSVRTREHVQHPRQCWCGVNDGGLCHDPSLNDHLFRGTRKFDKKRFIAKAVHVRSREHEVISALWCPSTRGEPLNHVIPILDVIIHTQDDCAFIIMEEWSSHIVTRLCCLRHFVSAMQQCIEHITFMHKHHIAHLDISLQNLVTDCKGRYACIDYERSQRFCPSIQLHCIENYRATEVPPEFETRIWVNPFKVDIWALGVLILRASKLSGLWIPELMDIVTPMVDEKPAHRPTAYVVLQAFNKLVACQGEQLGSVCVNCTRG